MIQAMMQKAAMKRMTRMKTKRQEKEKVFDPKLRVFCPIYANI